MDLSSIVSLSVGIISLFLSGFAIWLSMQFNDRSNKALDAISALAADIRSLAEVSLVHQKDFSSKMLDSILETNAYGHSKPATTQVDIGGIDQIIAKRLESTSAAIVGEVEHKIRKLVESGSKSDEDVQNAIKSIRNDMKKFVDTAASVTNEFVMPETQKALLRAFSEIPAFYILISAIAKTKSTSKEKLSRVEKEYHIPKGWEEAIKSLIAKGILVGSPEEFAIADYLVQPLGLWIDRNEAILKRLSDHYSQKKGIGIDQTEKDIARDLVF